MKKQIVAMAVAVALLAGVVWLWHHTYGSSAYFFAGLTGPASRSVVEPMVLATVQSSARCAPANLAVLLTDVQPSWLGLAQGLKAVGVPYCVTTDWREALRQRVVIVYPRLTGRSLPPEGLQAAEAHVIGGGTLIGFEVEGGVLPDLFGFARMQPSQSLSTITFTGQGPTAEFLEEPNERQLRVSQPQHADARFGVIAYQQPAQPALAVFDDGSAAIIQHALGRGRAYAIGLDLGHFVLRAQNGRLGMASRQYVNHYEPTVDVLLRLIRKLYRAGEPDAVTLLSVPQNKSVSVLITHDIDFNRSMAHAVEYARFEKSAGIVATYFVQTKYIRDYNDRVFFDQDGVRHLAAVAALGMEIGSHSVSHSRVFERFPMGSGDERYPQYRPFASGRESARDGTILGELRISRFLLEHFSGQHVESFRPGHLSNPSALPQALAATGFRFSSAVTANQALTHLPYQLRFDRGYEGLVGAFEFPVTIEDEKAPPLLERLPQALELARQIGRFGGVVNVLIHTDVTDQKLEFERRFVEALKPHAWFGSVGQFGRWWAARDQVRIGVSAIGARRRVLLAAPVPLAGLTLEVPASWILRATADAVQVGPRIVLGALSGSVVVEFDAPASR